MRFLTACFAILLLSPPAFASPKVIASIMPVHSIVANVMGNLGTPELLFSGKNSEHTASLSPEQISNLAKADVVFMIGLDQGVIPFYNETTTESKREPRRLFYVGLTRARHEVHMLYSGWRDSPYGRKTDGPSEFLLEVRRSLHPA